MCQEALKASHEARQPARWEATFPAPHSAAFPLQTSACCKQALPAGTISSKIFTGSARCFVCFVESWLVALTTFFSSQRRQAKAPSSASQCGGFVK